MMSGEVSIEGALYAKAKTLETSKMVIFFNHVHTVKRQTILNEDVGGGLMLSAEDVVTWDM